MNSKPHDTNGGLNKMDIYGLHVNLNEWWNGAGNYFEKQI